jgi:hypothetical protein
MRRSSFFLAIFLIALGAILLLRNTTTAWKDVSVGPIILIALGMWLAFERGWSKHAWWGGGLIVPLILVALGVVLLLRDLDVLPEGFTFGPVVLIAIGVAVLLAALPAAEGAIPTTTESVPLEEATSARVAVRHGAGRLTMVPQSEPGLLLRGTFHGGVDRRIRRDGGRVEVSLDQAWKGWSARGWRHGVRGFEWTVGLTIAVPLSLDVRTGASANRLDLEELRVTDLHVETGASQTDVSLPARGQTVASFRVRAAQLRVRIPPGVAGRIRTRGGLTGISIDRGRFPYDGQAYQSPDFGSAPNRVDLEIEAGAADVSVS